MDETMIALSGRALVPGTAEGRLVVSNVGLSFWGGVDPFTGIVIDRHHPLLGRSIAGAVLAIPSGRGSCTGSSVLLELILNGHAPAALVFAERDLILTLGVVIAEEMFGHSIPVLHLPQAEFATLRDGDTVSVTALAESGENRLTLTAEDEAQLAGAEGAARAIAMRIVTRMARLEGATRLIDVTQAHIDGCIYTGPASLRFAEALLSEGAHVSIPTSLNAISVDQRQWRAQGIDPAFGEPASRLADTYVAMGCRPTFTCAPYLLETAPVFGEAIVWAESNAVVFANSVIGARTMKYPDYLDIAIALTGRAPDAGCHRDEARKPVVRIDLPALDAVDDSVWPLLGYLVGLMSPVGIPLVIGLAHLAPSLDDLKAFSAAFGTSSAAPMFHILGVTPEAQTVAAALDGPVPTITLTQDDLRRAHAELDGAADEAVDLVSLGNPHFSESECAALASLVTGRRKAEGVAIVVTCGRAVREAIAANGVLDALETFGVEIVTDACWCMIVEPVIPPSASVIMTNSGKYAHYGPGLTGRRFRFGSLAACVTAAETGRASRSPPAWLS